MKPKQGFAFKVFDKDGSFTKEWFDYTAEMAKRIEGRYGNFTFPDDLDKIKPQDNVDDSRCEG